jgi:hypothetical protein
MLFPSDRVRHEFPLWAMYSRQVLPHVYGFPMLRVLCLIRHPTRIRPLGLPVHSLFNHSTRVQSGFREHVPFVSLTQTASCLNFGQERLGLPEFSDVSLPACHGLRTPADLHTLALTEASVLPSVYVKTLGVRGLLFRSFRVETAITVTIPPTDPDMTNSVIRFLGDQDRNINPGA